MKYTYILLSLFLFQNVFSQNIGDVVRYKKIDSYTGNLGIVLNNLSYFGTTVCNIGDINNDGIIDLAVGVPNYGAYGAVFILFLDTNGTVQSKKILTQGISGISGLNTGASFGYAIGLLGDINNDGTNDIVVSAIGCNDGGAGTGAIYIIKLNSSGNAISQSKISKTTGFGTGGIPIESGTYFGLDVDTIGDVNNDGNIDLIIGNYGDNTAGPTQGAAWVILLNSSYNVLSYTKIYDGISNFNANMDNNDRFGMSVIGIGDYNSDGTEDIAVGAHWDDDGSYNSGAFYIIHLNPNASIASFSKISNNSFTNNPFIGNSSTGLGLLMDIDGNGKNDIISGTPRIDSDRGGINILLMDTNETVMTINKINYSDLPLSVDERFGRSICYLGDYNSDGYPEIAVGSAYDDNKKGSIRILSLYTPLSASISKTNIQCYGDSTGMAVATIVGTNPPFTYLWSNGSTNDTINDLTAGTYSLTVTNSLGLTSISNCTITQNPQIALTTSNDTNLCSSASVNISCYANGGSGNKTLHWSNSLSSNNTHAVSPSTTTTYNVWANDALNCESDTSFITIGVSNTINASLSGPSLQQCLNDSSIQLVGTPAGGVYSGNGVIASSFEPHIAGVGIHQLIYTYTDTLGCSDADSIFTLINDIPTVNAGRDTLIPCGSAGALIGETLEALHTYLWSPYAGLNNPFTSSPLANPWQNTTFILTKTSLTTQCKNTDTVVVTLPPGMPLVNISGDTTICIGDSLHLSASSASTGSISWTNGSIGQNTDDLFSISQYIGVTLIDANLCIAKDSAWIQINPLPTPFIGNDTILFETQSLTLNAGNYQSYLWSTGANTQSIIIDGSTLGLGNQTFAVNVTDNNDCRGNDAITISIIDGIKNPINKDNISVFPNPAKDQINIDWDKEFTIAVINIYDIKGNIILNKEIDRAINSQIVNINNLSHGVYIIKLSDENGNDYKISFLKL